MMFADFGQRFQRYGTPLLITLSTLSLVLFPATMCFDCEPDYTWGRTAAINDFGWEVFLFWLVVAPLLAGFLKTKLGLLVPICIVLADVATQHLGGVPWWSVRGNEGPIIFLFGLPVAFLIFFAGWFCGLGYRVFQTIRAKTVGFSNPCNFHER